MPVYDYTYQSWTGRRRGPLARWMAIPRFAYLDFFGMRAFVALFTLSWIQLVSRLGYIYLLLNTQFLTAFGFNPHLLPPVDAFFFKNMIDIQLPLCFVFAFLIGSGLIARDMQNGAVVLFFTKPISRWEYFAGKFLTLMGLMMLITWVQTTFVFLAQWISSPAQSPWRLYFWRDYAWIGPAIAIYSTVVSATISLLILAISSMVKRGRYAGVAFAVFLIGTMIVSGIIVALLANNNYWALSPFHAGVCVGYQIFGIKDHVFFNPWAAWGGLITTCVLSALILWRRLDNAARYGR